MHDAYENAIILNKELVERIVLYQGSGNVYELIELNRKLENINKQEAWTVIKKLRLSDSYMDDMLQEAYIKLYWMVTDYYNPEACPVFITFWRSCLQNHLLTVFGRNKLTSILYEYEDSTNFQNVIENQIQLQELKKKYVTWVSSWTESKKQVPLCLELLEHRIFALPDTAKSQEQISQELEYSQAYISKWEKYLLQVIREENGNGLAGHTD